jgi:hypothetical protein
VERNSIGVSLSFLIGKGFRVRQLTKRLVKTPEPYELQSKRRVKSFVFAETGVM